MPDQGNDAAIFSGILIVFLPTLVLNIFLAEKIVNNVTAGAAKT